LHLLRLAECDQSVVSASSRWAWYGNASKIGSIRSQASPEAETVADYKRTISFNFLTKSLRLLSGSYLFAQYPFRFDVSETPLPRLLVRRPTMGSIADTLAPASICLSLHSIDYRVWREFTAADHRRCPIKLELISESSEHRRLEPRSRAGLKLVCAPVKGQRDAVFLQGEESGRRALVQS